MPEMMETKEQVKVISVLIPVYIISNLDHCLFFKYEFYLDRVLCMTFSIISMPRFCISDVEISQ